MSILNLDGALRRLHGPLCVDLNFELGTTGNYGVPYMWILTLDRRLQGEHGVPSMLVLALDGVDGGLPGGLRNPVNVDFNMDGG